MRPSVPILIVLSLSVLAIPGADAQVPTVNPWASMTMTVAQNATLFDPLGPTRPFPLVVAVTCGAVHADNPSYTATFTLKNVPPNVTAATLESSIGFSFQAADCIQGTANATQPKTGTLTIAFKPGTSAFATAELVVNTTLKRGGSGGAVNGSEPFDFEEVVVTMTNGFLPGLSADIAQKSANLQNDKASFPFSVSSSSNGEQRVSGTISNASPTLKVTVPEPFTLAQGARQDVTLMVQAESGCAERYRTFVATFEAVSTDSRGTGKSSVQEEFTVHCEPKKGGIPGFEGFLAVGVLVAWALRRRG